MILFSNLGYGFISCSMADLLTVAANTISCVSIISIFNRAVRFDTSKVLNLVWHAGLSKQKNYEFSAQLFNLIS